ncbi:hypothetical protein ES707_11072 [subsurface metagenome]
MVTVSERMLGVKLKLVDLPACQEINQAIQGLHRRNLIAADVEEHAPRWQVGPVVNLEHGKMGTELL